MKRNKGLYLAIVITLVFFGCVFIWLKYFTTKEVFLKEINGYSIYAVYNTMGKQSPMCGTHLIRKTQTNEEIARFGLCENNIVDISERNETLTVTASSCGNWEKNLKTGEEKLNKQPCIAGFSKE
jgi:hypothetical protein